MDISVFFDGEGNRFIVDRALLDQAYYDLLNAGFSEKEICGLQSAFESGLRSVESTWNVRDIGHYMDFGSTRRSGHWARILQDGREQDPDECLWQKILKRIAFSELDLSTISQDARPEFGIDLHPLGRIGSETWDDFRQGKSTFAVAGEIYRKPGKLFPGDWVGSIPVEFADRAAPWRWKGPAEDTGPVTMSLGIVADGATMMVRPNLWPQEVQDTCTCRMDGKQVCLPDVFWVTALRALLGDDLDHTPFPLPIEFTNHPAILKLREHNIKDLIRSYLEDVIPGNLNERHMVALLEAINKKMGEFLRSAFPGFSHGSFELYPSGVMALMCSVDRRDPVHDLEKRPLLPYSVWACTGDVSVAYEQDGLLVRASDNTIVDRHDRAMDAAFGGGERRAVTDEVIRQIARYRRDLIGNMQGGNIESAIQAGSTSSRCMVAYTDGLKHQLGNAECHSGYITDTAMMDRADQDPQRNSRYGNKDPFDFSAASFLADPRIAIREMRIHNFEYRRRPDEGSWLAQVSGRLPRNMTPWFLR